MKTLRTGHRPSRPPGSRSAQCTLAPFGAVGDLAVRSLVASAPLAGDLFLHGFDRDADSEFRGDHIDEGA